MTLIDGADFFIQVCRTHDEFIGLDELAELLDKTPTVDAVEVVRCKDCKHYNAGFECLKEGYGIERPQDWFCADGERREDE